MALSWIRLALRWIGMALSWIRMALSWIGMALSWIRIDLIGLVWRFFALPSWACYNFVEHCDNATTTG